jgi:hypothetical protein
MNDFAWTIKGPGGLSTHFLCATRLAAESKRKGLINMYKDPEDKEWAKENHSVVMVALTEVEVPQ